MRKTLVRIALFSILSALCCAVIVFARNQSATNVGEDAKKWDGGPGVPLHPDQKPELQMKIKGAFTVVAVGDLLEFQPFSKSLDPSVQYLVNLTRSADLSIGDLEDEIYDFDNFGHAGVNLGTKEVADDWANMGIKIVSRANNKDQNAPGVWEDFREVERVGIVHVGVAHSLPEARMARYLQLPQGLVGEVGLSAEGGTDACCTGGTVVQVTASQLAQVKAIKDSILARRGEVDVPVDLPASDPNGSVNVFGVTFTTDTTRVSAAPSGGGGRGGRGGRGGERTASPNDGVKNSLRLTLYHGVTAEQMVQLRAIAGDHGTSGDLSAFGTQFRVMARPGEHSFDMNQKDLREILTQIKTGKEASDFLAVNVHWHQNRFDFQHYSYDHFPADFEIRFAHDAIDVGADLVVAQGVHTIKGVEIYKGKPIFYGVSNYIFQSGLMPQGKGVLPGQTRRPDASESAEDPDATAKYANDTDGIVGEHETQGFWQLLPNLEGLLSRSHYQDGKLTEVRIYPVDLGQTYRPTDQVGIPRKPSAPVAKKILDELIEYSKPFKTNITVEDGVAIIHIPPSE